MPRRTDQALDPERRRNLNVVLRRASEMVEQAKELLALADAGELALPEGEEENE